MAGGQERALRRRVRSNQNIKKITHAMELIAASRIARDQQRVAAARPYAEAMTDVVAHLARAGAGLDQPLLETRDPVRTVGLVVVTADKGLAGGYNANVTRAADVAMAEARRQGRDARLYVSGKKGLNYFRFRNVPVAADWSGNSEQPRAEDARDVARAVREAFEAGEVDQVELIYTQFLSLGAQRVTTRRLLPLDRSALAETGEGDEDGRPHAEYEFEPEPEAILQRLLPLYVESRIYSAMLEAAASEHAARQRAMKSATDNASDLIAIYQRRANRVRQEAITTELVEVTGAAAALAAGSGG